MTSSRDSRQADAESPAPTSGQLVDADLPEGMPVSVPVPEPLGKALVNSVAFAFSALLSPYLVIPVGTVGIVATATLARRNFVLWTALSIFFSTVIPAAYVVVQILRGKITDVHVMEREQRGGPFGVALASTLAGAIVLRCLHAPSPVWSIGVIYFFTGLVMLWITKYWKISIHVAVLSATVVTALALIDVVQPWQLLWMIPALIWARIVRGRHTIWQGLAACVIACAMSSLILYLLHLLHAFDVAS